MLKVFYASSDEEKKYGLHYFDTPVLEPEDESKEEENDLEYEERSCNANCCDYDCECDDCSRCQDSSLRDDEEIPAAAA